MPSITDTDLRRLRQAYIAAYSAHQSCVLALSAATASGTPPSADLLLHKAVALREMTEARERFFTAWAQSTSDYALPWDLPNTGPLQSE